MMSLERLMLDHSPSMMLLVEPTQLQIVMANQGACQTLGYPEEALLGMTITDIGRTCATANISTSTDRRGCINAPMPPC